MQRRCASLPALGKMEEPPVELPPLDATLPSPSLSPLPSLFPPPSSPPSPPDLSQKGMEMRRPLALPFSTCRLAILVVLLLLTAAVAGTHDVARRIPTDKEARLALVQALRQDVLDRLQGLLADLQARKTEETAVGAAYCPSFPPETLTAVLPDPPLALGIHTPCRKFGRGCPDEYIEFLREYLDSLPPLPSEAGEDDAAVEKPPTDAEAVVGDGRADHPHPQRQEAPSFSSLPFPVSRDWTVAQVTRLEALGRYVKVLEGNLHREMTATWRRVRRADDGDAHGVVVFPSRGHCLRHDICTWAINAFLMVHPVIVELMRVLAWRLIPCAGVVAVAVWSLTCGPLTREETLFVLGSLRPAGAAATSPPANAHSSARPVDAAIVATTAGGEASQAVVGAAAAGAVGEEAAAAAAYEAARERARRRRCVAVSFFLLENHLQQETPFVFLKLRVALCLAASLIVLSSVFGFYWHVQALLSPSLARPRYGWSTHGHADNVSSSGTLTSYAHYLRTARDAPAAALRYLAHGAVSRLVPSWLVSYGSLYLGLSFLGSFLVMTLKGFLDALQELMDMEYVNAGSRERLLKSAL